MAYTDTVVNVLMLLVAHMVSDEGDDEFIHSISAWAATRKEKREYDQETR